MSRRTRLGLAAAAILAAAAFGTTPSLAAKPSPVDLSGSWQLDRSKSDLPGGPGGATGQGGFRRGGGEGGRSGRFGGPGGGNEGGEGLRPDSGDNQQRGRPGSQGRFGRRLPDFLHVTEQGGVVTFTDSTGAVFQEIRTPDATPDASATNPNDNVRRLTGHWDGGTLVAEMEGPRGTVVQKYSLEEKGRELDVHIERKGGSGGGGRFAGRDFKLVYRRAS